MKSSDERSGRAAVIVALVAFVLASAVRPTAVARFQRPGAGADIYALPPPQQLVIASLGYRAAFADLLFAHVLVAFGIHVGEKRRLEFVGDYVDAINALDPTFREPYRYADTFLVLTPQKPKLEHWQKAREIYRRGLENRPFDAELWTSAGQYLAYLAPPHLPTPELKREFKLEGARVLSRACELPSSNENLPYHCITAASLFSAAGEREAAIDAVRRTLQVTDDPEIESRELSFLRKKLDEREADRYERRKTLFRTAWKSDLPFVSKNKLLVVGPRIDPGACTGLEHAEEPECAPTWKSWARHADRLQVVP